MDFDALMKKKLGGKYNKPSLVESLPQTEDGQDQAKPKTRDRRKPPLSQGLRAASATLLELMAKKWTSTERNTTEVLIAKSVSLWTISGLF